MSEARPAAQAADGDGLTLAYGAPAPALRPWVRAYCGYDERTGRPVRRREMPGGRVVLIVDFGPTIRVADPRDPAAVARHEPGFLSGLYDYFAVTETAGAMSGVQADFTPLGARLFAGAPMRDLTNRVVGLDELFGAAGRRLAERLREAKGWDARFALLDRFIAWRIAGAREIAPAVAWAARQLERSAGGARIGALADEIGWSRKHLIARFHEDVGVAPKLYARLLRFERLLGKLGDGSPDWAGLAAECGYYDQAHLIRDVRLFTGSAPGELLRRMGDGGGFLD